MSGTYREIKFSVVVADSDKWNEHQRKDFEEDAIICEEAGGSAGLADDWVINRLRRVMQAAGEGFMQREANLFVHGTELM